MNKCQDCKWFHETTKYQGYCRRYPPAPVVLELTSDDSGADVAWQFANVLYDDYCGEWTERANRR